MEVLSGLSSNGSCPYPLGGAMIPKISLVLLLFVAFHVHPTLSEIYAHFVSILLEFSVGFSLCLDDSIVAVFHWKAPVFLIDLWEI